MDKKIIIMGLVAVALLFAGCTTQGSADVNSQATIGTGTQNTGSQNGQGSGTGAAGGTVAKGTLEVLVTDPNGEAVSGGVVEFFAGDDADAPKIGTLTTDSGGKATLENVAIGEIYIAAADKDNVYAGNSAEVDVEAGKTAQATVTLQVRIAPQGPDNSPNTVNITLESDDKGFYQNGTQVREIEVEGGATVNLTINQRTANSVWGGADIRSSAFTSFNVPNGEEGTISFEVNAPVKVTSYWPGSNSRKSDVTFTPQ